MEKLGEFIETHQQKMVLAAGYLLVALLAFGLGKFTQIQNAGSEIKVDQAFVSPTNYSPDASGVQTTAAPATTASASASTANCAGKIKGTSGMIYHLPGDAFYNRVTKPIACFDTEAQAIAAGFRKSAN